MLITKEERALPGGTHRTMSIKWRFLSSSRLGICHLAWANLLIQCKTRRQTAFYQGNIKRIFILNVWYPQKRKEMLWKTWIRIRSKRILRNWSRNNNSSLWTPVVESIFLVSSTLVMKVISNWFLGRTRSKWMFLSWALRTCLCLCRWSRCNALKRSRICFLLELKTTWFWFPNKTSKSFRKYRSQDTFSRFAWSTRIQLFVGCKEASWCSYKTTTQKWKWNFKQKCAAWFTKSSKPQEVTWPWHAQAVCILHGLTRPSAALTSTMISCCPTNSSRRCTKSSRTNSFVVSGASHGSFWPTEFRNKQKQSRSVSSQPSTPEATTPNAQT